MAVTANQKILTHNYWKLASKIEVGDYLFDKDGKPVRVKLVREYVSKNCYEVFFNDHLSVCGDDNLALPTENKKYRNRTFSYKGVQKFTRPLRPIKLSSLVALPLLDKRNRRVYSVPSTKAIELPHQDLPVHPFVFGFWLFNKNQNGDLMPPKAHFDFIKDKLLHCGYKLTHFRCKALRKRMYTTEPTVKSHLIPNVPSSIPNNYLLAAPDQRLELLSGILYAYRALYNKQRDRFSFFGKVYPLVKQIQYLAESLGLRTTLWHNEKCNEYILYFKSRIKLMEHQESPKIKVHTARRQIVAIEKIPAQMCVHIETEGADNSFLVGEGFISCL